jgi:metal-responsive CopG/Arc/MetJ family transcriptional regulator
MPQAKSELKGRRVTPDTMRASVSFPAEVYGELERIAATKKVSLAWVVRDAAERYVVEHGTGNREGMGEA